MAGAPLAPAEVGSTPGASSSQVHSRDVRPLQAPVGGLTLPPHLGGVNSPTFLHPYIKFLRNVKLQTYSKTCINSLVLLNVQNVPSGARCTWWRWPSLFLRWPDVAGGNPTSSPSICLSFSPASLLRIFLRGAPCLLPFCSRSRLPLPLLILQMRKLRLREVGWLVKGHWAVAWGSRGLNQVGQDGLNQVCLFCCNVSLLPAQSPDA